jgi:hypothetical protein
MVWKQYFASLDGLVLAPSAEDVTGVGSDGAEVDDMRLGPMDSPHGIHSALKRRLPNIPDKGTSAIRQGRTRRGK